MDSRFDGIHTRVTDRSDRQTHHLGGVISIIHLLIVLGHKDTDVIADIVAGCIRLQIRIGSAVVQTVVEYRRYHLHIFQVGRFLLDN